MSTSEKFCLKWNDFEKNINSAFQSLREDVDFADVTLACEDGQQVKAHRVILSASSPFFDSLLKRNPHPHPLIIMRGIEARDLVAVLDFLYYGQANIYQANLDNFLAIAEELKLKGLVGEGKEPTDIESFSSSQQIIMKPNSLLKTEGSLVHKSETDKEELFRSSHIQEQEQNIETSVAVPSEFYRDLGELNRQIESMMVSGLSQITRKNGKKDKSYKCQVCGKEGTKTNIVDHIEANHMEGLAIPCNMCEQTFRSRHSLRNHIMKHK